MERANRREAKARKILDKYGDEGLSALAHKVATEADVPAVGIVYADYVNNKHFANSHLKFAAVMWLITAVMFGLGFWKTGFVLPGIVFFANALAEENRSRLADLAAEHSKHTIMIAALGLVEDEEEEEDEE